MNVSNGKCIRHLSMKTMKTAKVRNIIAIVAIALTTVMFTSLFTVALSINHSFQQANFRQCGGFSQGTFKYLTQEKYNELKDDPLIKEYGLRRFVGMPSEMPFNKSHVEVGYSDQNQAHWMYCDPTEGKLPAENTNEAATDTHVLELLGVEPKLGNQFSITFDVDGKTVTETFQLCGWWEYDEAMIASHVLIPHSRVQAICNEAGIETGIAKDGMTGSWNLDVMFSNSMRIAQNMETILANHGYQDTSRTEEETYVAIGVNWGYTGSQLAENVDPMTACAIFGLLLLIVFTGYLIIYNVFQISVSNDIRYYGLLKTIGTTARQLKRMIRLQALLLSLIGIPIGMLIGYFIGTKLTGVVLARLNGVVQDAISANPLIFIFSAVFALITVLISCRKPGRMAAKVSPVEAVRYTENAKYRRKIRKSQSGISLSKMAWANLGRNRSKTAVTVLSLSLAVVLLNMTVTFTNGFDMDKYLSNVVSDFIVSDAGYFQVNSIWGGEDALPEDVINTIESQPGLETGGRVYGKCSPVHEFITEEYFRECNCRWNDEKMLDAAVKYKERNEDGLLAEDVQLYGMERYALDKMMVLEGDLSKLYDPNSNYIAAVYSDDDYGMPCMDSHWARLGDTVTLRFIEQFEYYDPHTGKILDPQNIPDDQPYRMRAVKYEEKDYQVAALIVIPNSMSYRYYGSDEFVMNAQQFMQDTNTDSVLYYACDVNDEKTAAMETFLSDYTQNEKQQFDYESKATYVEEFESFRSMFLILGGLLSFIVGLVGVLNYLNAILTSIFTRRREFAVLQSIGMTGKQLKQMLIWEGLFYAISAILVSLVLNIGSIPLMSSVLSSMFWFFTYRFTILPIICIAPIFAGLGVILPLTIYRFVSKRSIVERLRETE